MQETPEVLSDDACWPNDPGHMHQTHEDIFASFRHYANQVTREEALFSGIRGYAASTSIDERAQDVILFLGQFITRQDAEWIALIIGHPEYLADAILDRVRWDIEPRDYRPALKTIIQALPGSVRHFMLDLPGLANMRSQPEEAEAP